MFYFIVSALFIALIESIAVLAIAHLLPNSVILDASTFIVRIDCILAFAVAAIIQACIIAISRFVLALLPYIVDLYGVLRYLFSALFILFLIC